MPTIDHPVHQVAPFTGAWIETYPDTDIKKQFAVAPFTGAWIETFLESFLGADE